MDLLSVCQKCQGTGKVSGGPGAGEVQCDRCEGSGRLDQGEVGNGTKTLDERMTDLEDKVNDVMDKCNDIFEAVTT